MVSRNNQDMIADLKRFRKQLKAFKDLLDRRDSTAMRTSHEEREFQKSREELVRKGGRLKPIVAQLTGKQFGEQFGRRFDVWSEALGSSVYPPTQKWSLGALLDSVNEAIGRLEGGAVLETSSSKSAKAFIAHGGVCEALGKLEDFLRALDVEPLIVEEQASADRSVNTNVEHYLGQADCAIVLATKGDIDGRSGKFLPRGNVLVEAGRFQERFSGRTIYLLEDGASLPSNIREKVWEGFSQDNMDRAFIKIAKELSAFGIIKTGKPDK
jgi:predicted nucleotide-binding protein